MNKTMKVALCIGLAGLGVFVWTHSATAAKGKPSPSPVVVTFLSGDVSAAPQALPGPFTATIDFAKFIPYINPAHSVGGVEGGTALLNLLAAKNPITYTALSISFGTKEPCMLSFQTQIDGVSYIVSMATFGSINKTSTPTLDTFDLHEGSMAVTDSKKRILVIASNWAGGVMPANLGFTMTK